MNFPADQVDELRTLYPGVQWGEEGGHTYFLIPQLPMPINCLPASMDVLFCPTPRDGYPSRLFFSEQVHVSKALNWNAHGVRILERIWCTFSWRISEAPSLRLTQLLRTHMEALR